MSSVSFHARPTTSASSPHHRLARRSCRTGAAVAAAAISLAACGGDDDSAATTSTTTSTTIASIVPASSATTSTTIPAPVVTPTPSVQYVTAGASVMVANASRVDGGAGRLSERLAAVGYTTVAAGNYTLGQVDTSIVYYDPTNTSAKAVADSLRLALGGGNIQVLEIGTPPPVDSGTLGGAHVLVAMGNDTADKTLETLQGITTTTSSSTTTPEDTSAAETDTTEASA